MDRKEFLRQLYQIDPELAKMVEALMNQDQGLPDDRSITDIPKRELYDLVMQQGVLELKDNHKLVKCPKISDAVCAIHNGDCTGPVMEPVGGRGGLGPGDAHRECPHQPGGGSLDQLI